MARRIRLLAVVSWVGGAASVLPFASEWFGLSTRASNVLLFSTLVTAFAFGLLIGTWPALSRGLARLAGPPDPPARALVLVAVVACAGVAAMLAGSALAGWL